MAVGLLKHREAARLKREREGHWLGERKGDGVIREAFRLGTEREVKKVRERAARNWVVERSEREREREEERLERERAARRRGR